MQQENGAKRKELIIWITIALLLIGGYLVYKHTALFKKERDYYAYFHNIQGLQLSSPVQINGVRVGKISEIDINNGDQVKVTISVRKDLRLPEGTTATLSAGSLTGDKIIVLEPGPGPDFLKTHATLSPGLDSNLLPMSVRIIPMIETAKFILQSTDAGLRGFNYILNTGMLRKTAMGVIKADDKTREFARASAQWNTDASSTIQLIRNADNATARIASSSAELKHNLAAADSDTRRISEKKMDDNIANIGESINSLKNSFRKLNRSTTGFGKWFSNKETYNSISNSIDTLNQSVQQLQNDPPGLQIFGKKQK